MRRITLALLLISSLAHAQNIGTSPLSSPTAACSPSCSPQNFETDPLANNQWTIDNGIATNCTFARNAANGTLERHANAPSGFCGSGGSAVYNGIIAQDGCALMQVKNITGANVPWGFGFIYREYDGTGGPVAFKNYMRLSCLSSGTTNCDAMSIGIDRNGNNSGSPPATCNTFGSVSNNDWIGMCVRGQGANTVVNAFHFNSTDPGDPLNTDGGDGTGGTTWGTPACVFNPACVDGDCLDAGTKFGAWMNVNSPAFLQAGDNLQIDNFRVYSCQ